MAEISSLVLPFFGLILLGYGAARWRKLDEAALGWLNIFIIYVALPALFFKIIGRTPLEELARFDFILTSLAATYTIFLVVFLLGRFATGSTVGEASLKWLPSEVVTVTLTASRSLAETTYVNAPAIREQGLDLTIDYEIMHNLTAKLSLGYEEADFLETTRMDEIIRGRIGLDYTLNDNAVFTLSYEHRERDSSLDAYDADDNRYMAGVTLRF